MAKRKSKSARAVRVFTKGKGGALSVRILGKHEGETKATVREKASGFRPLERRVSRRVLSAVRQAEIETARRAAKRTDRRVYNPVTGTFDNLVSGHSGVLLLYAHRGKRENACHFCADCRSVGKHYWRYSRSNYGVVHLCELCKIAAFERSFGYADAMLLAIDHAHAHKGGWK